MYRRVVVQYFLLLMVFWSTTFSDGHNTLKKSSTTPRTGNSKNETVVDGMATEPREQHVSRGFRARPVRPEAVREVPEYRKAAAQPEHCLFDLCEEHENYPLVQIQKLLRISPELQQYFPPASVSVVNRMGAFDEPEVKETMCETKKFTSFPKKARNKDNVEMTVVNVGEYKQGITSEVCGQPKQSCKYTENFPLDKIATCEQRFATTRLMVLGAKGEKLVFDSFEVPSCCVCTITSA